MPRRVSPENGYTKRANRNLVRTCGASRVDILLMTIAATRFECIDLHPRRGFSRSI